MNFEERLRLDDGEETTLERWGSNGPVMLCVHGMTSSRKSWERFALHYSDRARVYAYDQRGHGDSAHVNGPMTLHRGLLDLYNVVNAIGEPVDTLAGHSWGGAVAILGGRRFDVARVVAIDPMIRQAGADWYDEFLRELKTLFAKKGAARDAAIEEQYAQLGWSALDVERKKHAVHAMTVQPIERLRDENPPESWDLRRDLEAYPKPLFLAMAQADESIVELDDLKHVRDRGGRNVALRVFEGQGHNLHRTDFDRFTADLDRFLGRT
ncbi:MAG: alpha/beta fold hydrolase [Candidatus Baltobacteraceae bacterium]